MLFLEKVALKVSAAIHEHVNSVMTMEAYYASHN